MHLRWRCRRHQVLQPPSGSPRMIQSDAVKPKMMRTQFSQVLHVPVCGNASVAVRLWQCESTTCSTPLGWLTTGMLKAIQSEEGKRVAIDEWRIVVRSKNPEYRQYPGAPAKWPHTGWARRSTTPHIKVSLPAHLAPNRTGSGAALSSTMPPVVRQTAPVGMGSK